MLTNAMSGVSGQSLTCNWSHKTRTMINKQNNAGTPLEATCFVLAEGGMRQKQQETTVC